LSYISALVHSHGSAKSALLTGFPYETRLWEAQAKLSNRTKKQHDKKFKIRDYLLLHCDMHDETRRTFVD